MAGLIGGAEKGGSIKNNMQAEVTMKQAWKINTINDLPEELPVFPLTGVLLVPNGELPLNVFEERYINMIDSALSSNRMIGIIQPKCSSVKSCCGQTELYTIGCAGRITEFSETEDGRYLVNLKGIARFEIKKELERQDGYRRIVPDWSGFNRDLQQVECLGLDRERLKLKLKSYFEKHNMQCSWDAIEKTPDQKLMATLAMVCPLSPQEKQALLEADDCKARADLFMSLLKMAICPSQCPDTHN